MHPFCAEFLFDSDVEPSTNLFTFEEIEEHLIKSKGDDGYEEDFLGSAVDKLGREKFVKFTLEFTMKAMVRDHDLKKYMENVMDEDEAEGSALDLISVTDHAFAFFQYINNLDKWTNKYKHRDDPEHEAHKVKEGRYSKNKGRAKHLDGVSTEGMSVYSTLVSFFDGAMKTTDWKEIKSAFDVEFLGSSMCGSRRYYHKNVKKASRTMDGDETSTLEVPRLPPLNDLFSSGSMNTDDSEGNDSDGDDGDESEGEQSD